MQKLIVILGPTASGKSDIAVALAKKFNGKIISADSRQVYKGLNIGTGKITKKEMRGVKHYLLDVTSPKKRFSASDFKKLAEKAIEEISGSHFTTPFAQGYGGSKKASRNKKIPIICGGTGFYIDALLGDKQIPEVPPNEKLRKQLEKRSVEELFEILKKLDPERARNIDTKNSRRLIRAIEICKAIGKVPPLHPEKQDSSRQANLKYEVLKIGIKIPEKELKTRIDRRLEKRMEEQGMIIEAKKLHNEGLSWKRMRELGLEYGALADFLEKKINKKEMIERLRKEIWHYAKRQMTWFKKDKNIIWFTPSKVDGLPPKIGLIEKEARKFL